MDHHTQMQYKNQQNYWKPMSHKHTQLYSLATQNKRPPCIINRRWTSLNNSDIGWTPQPFVHHEKTTIKNTSPRYEKTISNNETPHAILWHKQKQTWIEKPQKHKHAKTKQQTKNYASLHGHKQHTSHQWVHITQKSTKWNPTWYTELRTQT